MKRLLPTLALLLSACAPVMTGAGPATTGGALADAYTPKAPAWAYHLIYLSDAERRAACQAGYDAAKAGSNASTPGVARFTSTDGEALFLSAYNTTFATCLDRASKAEAFPDAIEVQGPSVAFTPKDYLATSRVTAALVFVDANGKELYRDVVFDATSGNYGFVSSGTVLATLSSSAFNFAQKQAIAGAATVALVVNFGGGLETFTINAAKQPGLR